MSQDFQLVTEDDFLKELEGVSNKVEDSTPSGSNDLLSIIDENIKNRTESEEGNNVTPTVNVTETEKSGESEATLPTNEEVKKSDLEEVTNKRFGVKDTILTLIETGEWEDTGVRFDDKEYDSIEELLSKEKPTKELFQMLSEAQRDLRNDKLSESYIPVGERNSVKAKLIEAIANDVPYEDLLQQHQEVIQPLQRLQFSKEPNGEQMAADFVAKCLIEIDGYHPASVGAAVEEMRKNFTLFGAAERYQDLTMQMYQQEIDRRIAEQQQFYADQEALYYKELDSFQGVANEIGLTDAFSKTLSDLRFMQDPNTHMYHYQQMIDERLAEDPQFAVDLMHFLVDQEDFINRKRSNVQIESTKRVLELVGLSKKTKGSKRTVSASDDDDAFLAEIGVSS